MICFRLITAGTIEENIFQRSFIKQDLWKVMVDERGTTDGGEERLWNLVERNYVSC